MRSLLADGSGSAWDVAFADGPREALRDGDIYTESCNVNSDSLAANAFDIEITCIGPITSEPGYTPEESGCWTSLLSWSI